MNTRVERQPFYPPEDIRKALRERVEVKCSPGAAIDGLAFVPHGETTMDLHRKQALAVPKTLGVPIAVVARRSRIVRPDVRDPLAEANGLSLKGVNDGAESVRRVADFPARLRPATVCESIPTRPPPERSVRASEEAAVNRACRASSAKVVHAE